MTLTDITRTKMKSKEEVNRELDHALGHGSIQRLVRRIIKYYLRRDCEKCCSRLEKTYEIAWHYDEEAAHDIKSARALLATAKERLR